MIAYLTKKLNTKISINKNLFYILYLLIFIIFFNINFISSLIFKNFNQFNLLNILASKNFNKDHFVKKDFDEENRNKFYNFCLNKPSECDFKKKFIFYIFGDTQANQFIDKIDNLENGKLVYFNTKGQCLFSSELKHANHIKYYLNKNSLNSCRDIFLKMDKILSESSISSG